MLLVLLFVALEPDVLPLVEPEAEVPLVVSVAPEVDPVVLPGAALPPNVVPLPVELPVVPVPAVVPDEPLGWVVDVPGAVLVVAEVEPGCTMAPPLAPSVPVVVAPWLLFTVASVARVPLLAAEAPDGTVVELVVAVCAMAPPATRDATRRLRSLLMR